MDGHGIEERTGSSRCSPIAPRVCYCVLISPFSGCSSSETVSRISYGCKGRPPRVPVAAHSRFYVRFSIFTAFFNCFVRSSISGIDVVTITYLKTSNRTCAWIKRGSTQRPRPSRYRLQWKSIQAALQQTAKMGSATWHNLSEH